MNSSNYGYPPSGYSSPFSSTPTGIRTQRPRFGYSGPSLYPRPRSSASKPNPESCTDSMINNYGNSNSQIDISFDTENGNSYNNDSYFQSSGSNYYSANDSFYNPTNEDSSYMRKDSSYMNKDQSYMRGDTTAMKNDTIGMRRDNPLLYDDSNMHNNPGTLRGDRNFAARGNAPSTGILPNPTSQFGFSKYPSYNNSLYGTSNMGDYKGYFQKTTSSTFNFGDKNKPPFNRRFGKAKRRMATPNINKQSLWRCELCSLDFTSQIPYDMHLGGAKHAKKLKAKEALNAVSQGINAATVQKPDGEKGYFCELCNVRANSLLQLQTHLEGSKHKNKLNPKESKDQPEGSDESKPKVTNAVNGKTNGSLTRPLPSDFGEPQPAKLTKYACDVCGISVNSEVQLQQHLSSKKHQNKVEGKPAPNKRKPKMEDKANDETADTTKVDTEQQLNETNNESKMVVGVKTLASSFVQGGTLQ